MIAVAVLGGLAAVVLLLGLRWGTRRTRAAAAEALWDHHPTLQAFVSIKAEHVRLRRRDGTSPGT